MIKKEKAPKNCKVKTHNTKFVQTALSPAVFQTFWNPQLQFKDQEQYTCE